MTDATGELLERDAELGTLTALLDAACDGSGAAAMIEGAPGVGKSALLARARNLAADRGMTVLSAQGGEIEREFAWGVVRQLFEPWLAGRSEAEAAELRDETAGLAAPVFGSAPAMGPDGDAFAELHGLFWMAVEVAQCGPVLIAVDDLQWADRPSLRFVVHLAPRLEGLPIALLVTTRPPQSEPAGDTGLLRRLLADPAVGHIAPAPLSPAATASLVRAGLSDAADGAFCEACHETTSGNPFLLVALVDALRADRAHPTAAAADEVRRMTPAVVTRTVLVRLAALPGDCLALARAVAVLGPGAELRLARRLAGLERRRALPAADLLVRAGILRGDATVDFVHPSVRSAVYHDLTATERGRFHQRAAALLTADGTAAEAVAPHLLATIPDGDPGIVGQLRAAAQQARARGAREPAVAYLERALAEPPGAAARSEVLLELGAAEALQRPDAAIAHLREALECA
ncbi:MAG TPA: AAA family ATPase, partial [Solirubrobacteraceae bacterium]